MSEDKKEKPKYSYEELSEKYISKKKEPDKDSKTKGFGKAYAIITSFIVTLVIAILLAIFVGRKLDEWLGTKAVFTVLFLLLGIAASFRNLIVLSK